MPPAFITALSATAATPAPSGPRHPLQPPAGRAPPPPPPHAPRKRVRVSGLTRKYRAQGPHADEALLVGTHPGPPPPDAPPARARAPAPPPPAPPVRLSRFPRSWHEAVAQACDATAAAAAAGYDRLRVDLRGAPPGHPALELDAAAALARHLAAFSASRPPPARAMFCPRGVVVLCPTAAVAAAVAPRLRGLALPARAAVLGAEPARALVEQLVVVVAPSNRAPAASPARIELVERVHYSNWNRLNWVVVLNPDLVSLAGTPGPDGQPRAPTFLADYCSSYFVDPAAFPSRCATGAVLRSFPRKWEMYLLKGRERTGFRLVAEQQTRPSDERIQCEFSWRVEREMETQVDAPRQLVG